MKLFKDTQGRDWTLEINVTAIRQVKSILGIDLFGLLENGFEPLSKLVTNPVQLADVLYCLCRNQAHEQGVTDEDFGRALAGDVLDLAGEAFVLELIDFFPNARARAGLLKVIDKSREIQRHLLAKAEKILEKTDASQAADKIEAHWMSASTG